jgi:hypothetical protein
MNAVLDLFRVLYEPTVVFERLRDKPRWLEPLLAIAVLYLIIFFLMQPFTKVVTEAAMQAAMQQRGMAPDQMPKMSGVFVAVGAVIAVLVLVIILVIGAVVLWVNTSIFAGEAKFGTLFSVTAYTSIMFVLQQAVVLVILMVRGVENVTSPDDLQPALGLDLLLPGAKGFLGGLLKGINPFSVIGYYLCGIGVSVTHKTSKGTGLTIAFTTYAVMLILGAALYMLRPGR